MSSDEHDGRQRKLFGALLGVVREKIINCPPIYWAEIDGPPSIAEKPARDILSWGICNEADKFEAFSSPESGIIILFGHAGGFDEGRQALCDVSGQIIEAISSTIPDNDPATLRASSPEKQHILAAVLIRFFVDSIREREPESLTFPQIISGKAAYHVDRFPFISFPTGKKIHVSPEYHQAWMAAAEAVKEGTVEIRVLQAPILHAVANVTKYILEQIPDSGPSAPLPGMPNPFIPTKLQKEILEALAQKALRSRPLAKLLGIDQPRLYKAGGIKELMVIGKIARHDRLGYYRPDSPPAEYAEQLSQAVDQKGIN